MRIRVILAFLIIVTLPGLAPAQARLPVTVETIKSELQMHVCSNDERLDAVKKLFKKMGAADEDIKTDKFDNVENLVITKKGRSVESIIIGAHYDKVADGCGAIDNWTGLVILANLYRAIKDQQHEKTYIFVAFGKEEKGLIGSNAMAKAIPKDKRTEYCAMINFDSFGLAYPQVLTNTSSSKMTKFAKQLAEEVKMPLAEASLAGVADADSSSFVSRDIPAITFHALSNKWQEYLHSSKDKIENINPQSVLVGYNFAALFVSKLDGQPCGVFRK